MQGETLGWLVAGAGGATSIMNMLQLVQAGIGIAVGIGSLVLTIILIRKNLRDARKNETQAASKTAGERKTNTEGNDES